MRRLKSALFCACLAAALLPAVMREAPALAVPAPADPAWPTSYDGLPLTRLPLTDDELRFAADTSIQMARFSDGRREILFRQIARGTRMLHSSAFCLRGVGFLVERPELTEDAQGRRWSRFAATRGTTRLTVCERIEDAHGQAWTDVSAWYWAALCEQTQGPWMAIMLREQDRQPADQKS